MLPHKQLPPFKNDHSNPECRGLRRKLHNLIIGCVDPTWPVEIRGRLDDRMHEVTDRIKRELESEWRDHELDNVNSKALLRDEKLRDILNPLLGRLLELVFDPTYSQDDPEVAEIYRKTISCCLTPHIFVDPATENERLVPLTPMQISDIETETKRIWQASQVLALAKLEHFKEKFKAYDRVGSKRKNGRCAEVHPVVGIGYVLPLYQTSTEDIHTNT